MPSAQRVLSMVLLSSAALIATGCHYSYRCLIGRDFFPCAVERCSLQSDVHRIFEMHVVDTDGTPQPADIYVEGQLVLAGTAAARIELEFDWADDRYGWIPLQIEVRTQEREPQQRRLQFNDATHQVFYVARLEGE